MPCLSSAGTAHLDRSGAGRLNEFECDRTSAEVEAVELSRIAAPWQDGLIHAARTVLWANGHADHWPAAGELRGG
jgi:hypothetical protein